MSEFQAEFTPLHVGTIATFDRRVMGAKPPIHAPFKMFGDRSYCTHFDTVWGEDGHEVEDDFGRPKRTYCANRRGRGPNGFLCDYHQRSVNPTARPSGYDPTTNMIDGRLLVETDGAIIKATPHTTVRLLATDERIKLRDVGFMRILTLPTA